MVRKRSCPAVSHYTVRDTQISKQGPLTSTQYPTTVAFLRGGWTHNLQLHCLPIQLNRPDLEVHANGRDVALRVRVVGEPEQQTRFPHARVSDQQQLEEVVVSSGGC